jgi:hypothetical protein
MTDNTDSKDVDKPSADGSFRGKDGKFLPGNKASVGNIGGAYGKVSIVKRLNDYLHDNPDKLDKMVEKAITRALDNVTDFHEITNRIDGKAVEHHKIDTEIPINITFAPLVRISEQPALEGSCTEIPAIQNQE